MNTIPDSLVKKIQGLLALAESSNPAEAEAAMAKAQEWAVKYQLDLSTVKKGDEKAPVEPIIKNSVEVGARACVAEKFVSWVLTKHFNVKMVYHKSRYCGSRVTFIGRVTDIQLAEYLYEYLQSTFMKLWRGYKDEKNAPVSERSSYIYGLYQGLCQKLEEARTETETSYFAAMAPTQGEEAKGNYTLALVSNKEELENKLNEFYPSLGKAKSTPINTRSVSAIAAGRAKGGTINTNRPLAAGSVTPKLA